MPEVPALLYPWLKALHVISVISWMAGLLYLPRLFVHHVEQTCCKGEKHDLFVMMERRLLRLIMNPAMIATWAFGLALLLVPGIVDWSQTWPWAKAAAVLAMTWYHHWLAQRRKTLETGRNALSGRNYRLMNEVPTILMIVIVFSVMLKF
ncbi:MAG: protoporphyrinogen oxidase HemJ [Boseongicola sp. SB0664_bin_43]|uniref:Protoporphyrinogen IX oxidase n=1 Tax=Boseongicola sp. SB0664_bin_43 TaxID=2604844 RepID=A0A6B0Y4S4_9RHOB|nr:protoporphyrinogen oxidase HemJ [Boseongicola sp. SB0664_bin_43]